MNANTMTVKECADNWSKMSADTHILFGPLLLGSLCGISHATLMKFHRKQNANQSYEEFLEQQGEEIRACVAIECSDSGKNVRSALGLKPLTLDTVLERV